MDTVYSAGAIIECKEHTDPDGQKVGVIEGYIATWDLDEPDMWGERDRFEKGAFLDSLADHKTRDRRVRLKSGHSDIIGVFAMDSVVEDDTGLFGVANINLDLQLGRDIYALVKQKAITDFSIGFITESYTIDVENEVRTIQKARIMEGSLVSQPRNQSAVVTDVKNLVTVGEIKDLTPRELEQVFKKCGLSRNASKLLASRAGVKSEDYTGLLDAVRGIKI